MRHLLKDIWFGILIVIVAFIFMIITAIIIFFQFGEVVGDVKYPTLNIEMLISAFFVLFTSRNFARRLKTENMLEATKRGLLWTFITTIALLIMSNKQNEIGIIFSRIGTYVLLLCVFLGPVLYVKQREQVKSD
jgi:hypothetical protein